MRRSRQLMLTLALALGASACDEKLSTLAGPTPNLEPTFASIQRDIFETTDVAGRVSCVTCHTNQGRTPAGGMNLVHDLAYDQLVNVNSTQVPSLKRVNPGNPDASYMAHKIEGRPGIVGRRMPFNGPPYLSDGQILIMRRWIELGAPRN
ncbi:MAG TPA: hypothetical protein VM032_18425 [Vicinamibacterales bacterium]|nr:hypothetical protein [Vicinamibacterales bacterium]